MKYSTIYNDPVGRSNIIHPWTYWDDGFTETELNKLENYCDSLELINATTVGSKDNIEESKKIRKSHICWIHKNDKSAWIFNRLNFIVQNSNEQYYNFDLNGYECIQYTMYNDEEKGNYGWHMDMCMEIDMGEPRKLSLTLLLNDGFEGGKFQINKGVEKNCETVPTKKGRAIIFPSWLIHQVTPVTKGTRKSIVVWVTGPKFQ